MHACIEFFVYTYINLNDLKDFIIFATLLTVYSFTYYYNIIERKHLYTYINIDLYFTYFKFIDKH